MNTTLTPDEKAMVRGLIVEVMRESDKPMTTKEIMLAVVARLEELIALADAGEMN